MPVVVALFAGAGLAAVVPAAVRAALDLAGAFAEAVVERLAVVARAVAG